MNESMNDAIQRMIAKEAERAFRGAWDTQAETPSITVKKIGATFPVSQVILCDNGLCDHDHSKDPKPKIRWRWRLSSWWYDHKPHLHLGPCPREEYDE